MSTESHVPESFDNSDVPPPIALVDTAPEPEPKPEVKGDAKPKAEKPAPKVKAKEEDEEESGGAGRVAMTKEMKEIQANEDRAVKDTLDDLGEVGSFKIKLSRVEPEEFPDPVTRVRVKTAGHLRDYFEKIDESLIQKNHGGGRYRLQFFKKNGQGGKMTFFTSRTIDVTGDPRLDDVPRTIPAAPTSGPTVMMPPAEDGKVATAALGMAERMMDKMASQQPPAADHKPYEMMIQAQAAQIERQSLEMAELRRMIATANQTPKNPLEDKLISKLVDEDSARMQALRMQHESEMRTVKEHQYEDIKRIEQRHERAMADMKASFERELASMRNTQDILRSTQQTSTEVSTKMLEGQIRSLEREVASKDKELAELRARKDKSLIEQIKEMKTLKEAITGDEDEAEQSTVDKLIDAVPQMMPQIQSMFGKGPQAAAAPAPVQQAPRKRQVIKGPQGERYIQGKDGNLVLVAPKPAPLAPGEPQIPQVPPAQVAQIVNLLERAFEGNQPPEVVAQSVRPMIAGQEEILQAVRALGGVDAFLAKVANLPSSSPLLTQAGKNWVRKFSKELVGD